MTMSLSDVPRGKRVTIVSLNLAKHFANRLTSLGLVPGARIRVIDNSLPQTSLIECLGTRLALGRGIPDFIDVR